MRTFRFTAPRAARSAVRSTVLAAVALLAVPTLAVANGLVLRGDVVVEGDAVSLGDVVANAGPRAGTPLFRAPAPGATGTIQASRLRQAVRDVAGVELDLAGRAQVTITRAARRIDPADVESTVAAAVGRRHGADVAGLTLSLDDLRAPLVIESRAKAPLRVTDFTFDPRTRAVEAWIDVADSALLQAAKRRVSGRFVETVDVAVLRRTIERGETVQAGDVAIERRPRLAASEDGLIEAKRAVGRGARSRLLAGAALREGDLVRIEVVERNSLVTLAYDQAGIALSLRVRALEAGAVGDVVSVRNEQSRRVVPAVVTGPGRVAVQADATPSRVASVTP